MTQEFCYFGTVGNIYTAEVLFICGSLWWKQTEPSCVCVCVCVCGGGRGVEGVVKANEELMLRLATINKK
jgi:hypothetical protein